MEDHDDDDDTQPTEEEFPDVDETLAAINKWIEDYEEIERVETPIVTKCSKCEKWFPPDHFPFKCRDRAIRHVRCKSCFAEYARQVRRERPEQARERDRESSLRKRYGMTTEEYRDILDAQEGRCALCLSDTPGRFRFFSVDHDHVTGRLRGLLCYRCNSGLAVFGDGADGLERALRYVRGEPLDPQPDHDHDHQDHWEIQDCE